VSPSSGSASGCLAEAPYDLLVGVQRELWMPALVCSSGLTRQRLHDLALWEQALLAGCLPEPARDFGDAPALAVLRPLVAELDLCRLTQGSAPMVRQVLRAMLWHLDRLVDRPVGEPRAQAIGRMATAFRDAWTQQRQGWDEVLLLLKSLGDLPDLRWDDLRGRLASREWAQARRIQELLAQLPELSAFIDAIGRATAVALQPPADNATERPERQRPLAAVAVHTHLVDQPSEVRGVKRSGQIARMLASEAAMVRHPLLQRLWRARFAEQQLLTYEDEAVLTQWQLRPDARRSRASAVTPGPLGRGPMLVCLDTSGSMRGAPENVAKACVLQALHSAHARRRACTLLAFGGTGELLERNLAPTIDGLDHLLDLMGQGFDGGTDVQTPLERAVALVDAEPAYLQADILVVSDGEFGVTPATLAMLRACKARRGLRVHAILVGDRETIGLLEVSDQIHWVRAWRRYATDTRDAYSDGFSPVHSRSLTALYFPNAVRR
jgi:uncharacterized protein with von Willebrand factor type A (vWA) domain